MISQAFDRIIIFHNEGGLCLLEATAFDNDDS